MGSPETKAEETEDKTPRSGKVIIAFCKIFFATIGVMIAFLFLFLPLYYLILPAFGIEHTLILVVLPLAYNVQKKVVSKLCESNKLFEQKI